MAADAEPQYRFAFEAYDVTVPQTPVSIGTLLGLGAPVNVYQLTVLADTGNSATVYIGIAGNPTFPLVAGSTSTDNYVDLSKYFLKTTASSQTVHIKFGGGPVV